MDRSRSPVGTVDTSGVRAAGWWPLALWVPFLALTAVALTFSTLAMFARRGDLVWLYGLHAVGGAVVLLLAPFQFVRPLRERFRRWHRGAGYAYLAGSALGVVTLLAILPRSECSACLPSQALAATLWAACAALAWRAARARDFEAHARNMARSVAFAGYFVVVRTLDQIGLERLLPFVDDPEARFANSDWLAWFVPLLLVEIGFESRRRRGRTAGPRAEPAVR